MDTDKEHISNGVAANQDEEKTPLRDSAENLATSDTEKYNEDDDNAKNSRKNGSTPKITDAALEKEKEAFLPDVDFKKSQSSIAFTEHGPKDKFMVVYFILLIHGIGTLMPWNMFITATEYFTEYKLAPPPCETNTTDSNVTKALTDAIQYLATNLTAALQTPAGGNGSIPLCEEESSLYRNYFLSSLGFAAQVPNVLLNAINVFARVQGGNTSKRIIWSIIIIIIMFIFTIVLAMVDSSAWPDWFFWITMILVVLINMANGVYQNSVYGTAAVLPMKYTNAVVLGSNISGTLTSIIMLISMASAPNVRTSAIYYFLAAIFILIIAFDTYFILPFMPFYRHHRDRAEEQQQVTKKGDDDDESKPSAGGRPPYLYIFKRCWKQFVGVWFTFFVTLTCFPAIQANVKKVDGDKFPIPNDYFTAVTCFLFFNFFAMIGNLVTEFVRKPGPRWVWLPVLIRVLFIPFFVFCNFMPKSGVRGIPVLIPSNWVYVIGGIVMAFTSGYFSSLTMMYAPGEVKEPEYKGIAGMMAAFFLISGIFSGIIFSFPVTMLVEIM